MKFSSMFPLAVLLVVFSSSNSRGSPILKIFKNHHHHHHYSPYPPPPPPLIPIFAQPSLPQLPIYEPVHIQPAYKPAYVPVQQPYPEYYQKKQYNPPYQPEYQQHQHQATAYPAPVEQHQQYQPTVYTHGDSTLSSHLPVEHKEPQGPPVFVPGQTDAVSSGNLPPLFFGDVPSNPGDTVGDFRERLVAIETLTQTLVGGVPTALAANEIPSLIQGGGISRPLPAVDIPSLIQGGGVPLGSVTNAQPEPIAVPNNSLNVADLVPTLVQTSLNNRPIVIGNEASIIATTYRPVVGDPAFTVAKTLLNTQSNSGFAPISSGFAPTHTLVTDNPFSTPSKSSLNAPSRGGSFRFPTEAPVILVDERPVYTSSRSGKFVFPSS